MFPMTGRVQSLYNYNYNYNYNLSFFLFGEETLRFDEVEGQDNFDNFQVSSQLTNPKMLFPHERTIIEQPWLLPQIFRQR